MRLFHDCAEAVNANTITPDETKFCYMEVKLISDQEQFGSKIKIIEHTPNLSVFKLSKTDEYDGQEWFDAGKHILVNYNIPATTFRNGVQKR